MEMWFHDEHTDNVKLAIRVDYQVFSAQSEIQRIDGWRSTNHRARRVYLS